MRIRMLLFFVLCSFSLLLVGCESRTAITKGAAKDEKTPKLQSAKKASAKNADKLPIQDKPAPASEGGRVTLHVPEMTKRLNLV